MEPLFSRYSLQLTETELVLSFGAGICSPEDTDICLVFLYILEDAVFPLPVVYPNGTIVWPEGNEIYTSHARKPRPWTKCFVKMSVV